MHIPHIIEAKRDGRRLSDAQIGRFIAGYVSGEIPDYQMAALAMAIYFQGMDIAETAALTRHMLDSGGRLARLENEPPRVDKHSTGGVGDKVSLVLAPLMACCGLHVPMISGRGLGATGGTLDKLEAIPGFRTDLNETEIGAVLEAAGCVITGQTATLVPADRKLYALRDVTATVPSWPLITASILSKKLAETLDALVLDVKFGGGAFMKTREQAQRLADSLCAVARQMGLNTEAVLSDMNQPLGRMAGNAVEVIEAQDILAGRGPRDVVELVLALGSRLLRQVDPGLDEEQAKGRLRGLLASGAALERFERMVRAQGGDPRAKLEVAPASEIAAPRAGRVTRADAGRIGQAIQELGGGRSALGDTIDFSVGVETLARVGDEVDAGQPLAQDVRARPR